MEEFDAKYLSMVLTPIRSCAKYKPKLGQGSTSEGVTLAQFQVLYASDPFYSWFGLDNPLLYAAHKAAGGMTSVYRQIGIGCEQVFRHVLMDQFGLSKTGAKWFYEIPTTTAKMRKLTLDARVSLDDISDPAKKARLHEWMRASAESLAIAPRIFDSLTGTVFEVRQGYKSKDSKRQQADIANAAAAYTKAYLPCAAILSGQIDPDLQLRYRAQKWVMLTGVDGLKSPMTSTYEFMRQVVGYDLAGFFKRNSVALRSEIDAVLKALLTPETIE